MSDTKQARTRVAVLGLGAMGGRMAHRLLAAGHQVVVWNRTPAATVPLAEAGATVASTPEAAAHGARFVLAMVRDDQASHAVWLGARGAIHGLGASTVALDASTLTPAATGTLGERLAAIGASFLETPVIGSRPQAEAGQLIVLAGGDGEVVERAEPVLRTLASAVHHVGGWGRAAAAKLAVNTFFASQVAAAAEAVGALRRAGIDDARWLPWLKELPVVAPPIAASLGGMAAGRFDPLFPIALVAKDLSYFLDTFGDDDAMPVARAVRDRFLDAIAAGYADDNIHGIVQLTRGSADGQEGP